ncbi:hypothetical protein ACVWW3_008192 [Bradyrhizobium sp. LM2.9]
MARILAVNQEAFEMVIQTPEHPAIEHGMNLAGEPRGVIGDWILGAAAGITSNYRRHSHAFSVR